MNDVKSQLISDVPIATSLIEGMPVAALEPSSQDVLSCRTDSSIYSHKISQFTRTSPFSIVGRAAAVLQQLLCLQKFTLHTAAVFGEHLTEIRAQTEPSEQQHAIRALLKLVPSGHRLDHDSFEAFEDLFDRLHAAAASEASIYEVLSLE